LPNKGGCIAADTELYLFMSLIQKGISHVKNSTGILHENIHAFLESRALLTLLVMGYNIISIR